MPKVSEKKSAPRKKAAEAPAELSKVQQTIIAAIVANGGSCKRSEIPISYGCSAESKADAAREKPLFVRSRPEGVREYVYALSPEGTKVAKAAGLLKPAPTKKRTSRRKTAAKK